jgi:CHAT domain-containing protein
MVLAGVHRRAEAAPGDEDGVLTSEEIASLDLGTVEWAVLSGCGTGLGTLQPGEGVLGLQRAFRIAGAGSLVMSLWEVEDRATRDWMARFYEVRLSGSETFTAARAASLGTLRARREAGKPVHPFYWAAFVTDGAGR